MNYYLEVLKKYATFTGRARRKEYWMFLLFNIIIAYILLFIDNALGTGPLTGSGDTNDTIFNIYTLAIFVPFIAVVVRRLHDTNRSGKWILLTIVPIFVMTPIFTLLFSTTLQGDPGATVIILMILAFALMAISMIGSIIIFVFSFLNGTVGPNKYGEDPKGVSVPPTPVPTPPTSTA